eukprot:1187866-Rhodomonas_salina.1
MQWLSTRVSTALRTSYAMSGVADLYMRVWVAVLYSNRAAAQMSMGRQPAAETDDARVTRWPGRRKRGRTARTRC